MAKAYAENANTTNASIFNAVRAVMSKEFQDRIPEMNAQNMKDVGLMITSNDFELQRNQWQNVLFNRIGLSLFHDYTLENPLAKYIYGEMEWGDAIQEIATDIVTGRSMDYGEEGKSVDPWVKNSPEAKAIYHRINEPIQYSTTIEKDRIKRAFLAEGGLRQLLNSFVNKLYSSANVDSWTMTKSAMAYYINNGHKAECPLLATQVVQSADVTDLASAQTLLLQVKNALSAMKFPNNKFNPMGIHKTLQKKDLVLFVRADVLNAIGVKAFTEAFHTDPLTLNITIEEMDDFGIDVDGNDTEDVIAVLAERNWLLITHQFDDMESIYNPRARYWNYFLTRQMSYGSSYFKDAVIFRKDTSKSLS